MLGQRAPQPVARAIKQALVEAYGAALDLEGERYWAFPEPAALVAAPPTDLQALVRNERKAAYLLDVARAFAGVDELWLRTAPYPEVEAWLLAIKGIGPWSASFVLARGLGRMERAALDFPGFAEAAARVYGLPTDVAGRAGLARIAARYGPHQGYWLHYIKAAQAG